MLREKAGYFGGTMLPLPEAGALGLSFGCFGFFFSFLRSLLPIAHSLI